MKQAIKKLTSAALALAMGVSMAGNVFASEIEETEYVQVAGYTCTVEDGRYYTEIDGEKYLVINLDELMPEFAEAAIAAYAEEKLPAVNPLLANDSEIYSDTVNLNRGDYISPIIDCNPTSGLIMKTYSALFPSSVNLIVHMHIDKIYWVPTKPYTLWFDAVNTSRNLILAGYAAQVVKQCKIEFLKDGTSLPSPFSYALYEY